MKTSREAAKARRGRGGAIDWIEAAARLASIVPRTQLHPALLKWADGKTSAARGPWGVALSGGADSVALLLLVWAHWPERRARLRVFHFNHRLRGRAADRDEAFCGQLCRGLGVRFAAGRWRTPRRQASEAEARAARFAFLDRVLRAGGRRALWLGHQQDDIAESMLMRLARGSGTGGLAAPRPVQAMPDGRVHLRPLLTQTKAELAAALRQAGAAWREDASNAGDRHLRNRIRQAVIPAWQRAAGPRDARLGAAIARELLEEDAQALDEWLGRLAPLRRDGSLDLTKLGDSPRAIWRRALHVWLGRHPLAGELSRQAFNSLLDAAEAGRPTRRSLGATGFAVVRGGTLRWVSK